jgi:hypothetical protein
VALYGGLLLLLASWVGRRWFSALAIVLTIALALFVDGADVPRDASPDRQRCGRDHGPPRTRHHVFGARGDRRGERADAARGESS